VRFWAVTQYVIHTPPSIQKGNKQNNCKRGSFNTPGCCSLHWWNKQPDGEKTFKASWPTGRFSNLFKANKLRNRKEFLLTRRHVKTMNATVDFYLIINTGRRNLDTTRDDTRTHMHTNETLCDSKTVAADVLAEVLRMRISCLCTIPPLSERIGYFKKK
jgi:hypothetical protein